MENALDNYWHMVNTQFMLAIAIIQNSHTVKYAEEQL